MAKVRSDRDVDLKGLRRYFESRGNVELAYVFGSAATSPKRAKDLDIAVLLREDYLARYGSLRSKIRLEIELRDFLKRPNIDVVVLNDAPLLLRHEVIRPRKVIYEQNLQIRCDFEVASELRFYDFEPIRRLFWDSLVRRVKEGRLFEKG